MRKFSHSFNITYGGTARPRTLMAVADGEAVEGEVVEGQVVNFSGESRTMRSESVLVRTHITFRNRK